MQGTMMQPSSMSSATESVMIGSLSRSNVPSTKSMAMLGLDAEPPAVVDPILQDIQSQGYWMPPELEVDGGKLVDSTIPELYSIHLPSVSMFEQKETERESKRREELEASTFQLVFDIQHCIFRAGGDTILFFSLFNNTQQRYITEEYRLQLTLNNFPTVGAPQECKVLFKDLMYEDLREDLYIVCKIYRLGPMAAPNLTNGGTVAPQNNKGPTFMRPFAATVVPLQDRFDDLLNRLEEEVKFEPSTAQICCPENEHRFSALPFELIARRRNGYTIAPMSIGVAHSLILYQGDAEVVNARYEFAEHLTRLEKLDVNPISFTERHMLYVTVQDVHVSQGTKRAPCNVQMKVQLRDNATLAPIPGAVMMGKGPMAQPSEEGISSVFYHTNDPIYEQMFSILIPMDIKALENCHLYFSFSHQSNRKAKADERGFAFLPLFRMNTQQLTSNNAYDLPLYQNDRRNKNDYLNLETGGAAQAAAAGGKQKAAKTCRVIYHLCSTKIFSDVDIHRFLTWRHYPPQAVAQALKLVSRKQFEHLISILDDLMNCIFEVMLETQEEVLIEQTFATLVAILGEVNKKQNEKYRPRIDRWIEENFRHPRIWRVLADQQLRLLQWIASPDAVASADPGADPASRQRYTELTRHLQLCMKGVGLLFKLIKRSCDIEKRDGASSRVDQDYANRIRQLFKSLNKVMSLSEPKSVAGVQWFALRNFLTLLETVPNQNSRQMTQMTIRFIDSVQMSGEHNNVEKLLLIRRFLAHPALLQQDIVEVALPAIANHLEQHIASESFDERVACATVLKTCVPFLCEKSRPAILYEYDAPYDSSIVNRTDTGVRRVPPDEEVLQTFTLLMLQMFEVLESVRNTDLSTVTNVQRIFGHTVSRNPNEGKRERTLSAAEANGVSQDQLEIHRDFFVTLADLARTLSDGSGDARSFGLAATRVDRVILELRQRSEDRAIQVIRSVLQCCSRLLQDSLFPQPWVFMRMVEAEVGIRALSWLNSSLKQNYHQVSFNKDLWQLWLALGMSILSGEEFALEYMPEVKAELILSHYGDVRLIAIKQVRSAWDILTDTRQDMTKIMLVAAMKTSTSSVPEIEEFAIDLFYQMLKSECEASESIDRVVSHTIDEVDDFISTYSKKEALIARYKDFFCIRVREKLEEDEERLRELGLQFIQDIDNLFDYLVKLYELPLTEEFEDERTAAVLSLLDYLRQSGKTQLYQRYMHLLALMHQELGNHVEAAICYLEHAELLGWSETVLREQAQINLSRQTETKRHIFLYDCAEKAFMRGDAWEMSIRVCQKLAHVYEHELFDLKAIPAVLEKQATFWKLIAQQDRVFHACYLVVYHGDFPSDIRGQSFIYRSGVRSKLESVREFTDRIKSKFPNAQVINGAKKIPDEVQSDDYKDQYIRITTLNPASREEMNGGEFKWDKTNAPLRMKKYYREMETDVFFFTQNERKEKEKKDAITNVWVTKTFVVAAEKIPSKRRRIPVVEVQRLEMSPLEAAISTITSKTGHLNKVMEVVENDLQHDVRDLSMTLSGILDAKVMGGITEYYKAFFGDRSYFDEYPRETPKIPRFVSCVREALRVAELGLRQYREYGGDAMGAHVDYLVDECLPESNLQFSQLEDKINMLNL